MNMISGRGHYVDIPEDQGKEVLIRARAHQLWFDAGKPAGQDLQHWLQAEQEVDAFARAFGTTRRCRWHWYKPATDKRSRTASLSGRRSG